MIPNHRYHPTLSQCWHCANIQIYSSSQWGYYTSIPLLILVAVNIGLAFGWEGGEVFSAVVGWEGEGVVIVETAWE